MADRFRYRITFAKTEAMRFTGHLDMYRTWERTLRRAGLGLAYSEGFNPRPKMHLAAALPLGSLSQNDLLDVWLEQAETPEEVRRRLEAAAPPGIRIRDVQAVPGDEPALPQQIAASVYEVSSHEFPPPAELSARVARLLAQDHLPRLRRGKAYDLRPLIEALSYDEERRLLRMQLAAREGATGRPEEVLAALGLEGASATMVRTGLRKHALPRAAGARIPLSDTG